MTDEELAESLTDLALAHKVPGAQAVVRYNGSAAVAACGVENVVTRSPVTAHSQFPAGSLTKPFTAALAMMLVDDEDIGLDEPMSSYLPEFEAGQAVTLRHLLSHTSGLFANVAEETSAVARREWVGEHGAAARLLFRPGSVFSYSNAGYVVVGLATETILGLSWREAVRDLLAAPLGLEVSLAGERNVVPGHGIRPADGEFVVVDQCLPELEAPNGALATSAASLAALADLFMPGSDRDVVLSRPAVTEMCTDQLGQVTVGPFGLADGWALGWARYGVAAQALWGHDGTGEGSSCHLRFHPATGALVAVTTNSAGGYDLWRAMATRLAQAGFPAGVCATGAPPLPARADDPGPLDRQWFGRYVNGSTDLEVSPGQDGQLVASTSGVPQFDLVLRPGMLFDACPAGGHQGSYPGRFLFADGVRCLQVSGRLLRQW